MNEDTAFLRAILANPKDDAARLVYADWLEERGDPRAEFIRVECELARLEKKDRRHRKLKARLRELNSGLDSKWLAVVSRPPIENCEIRFKFRCPKKWDQLKPTDDDSVRFCEACRRNVYYCSTVKEGRLHAWRGDCVAIDLCVERTKGDIETPEQLVFGVVLREPPFEEDNEEPGQDRREHRRRRR